MKLVFFDLGDTLESGDVLLPGALETLQGIADLRSSGGEPAVLGLISDFDMPGPEYYAILDLLGIRSFFEPVATRVTLSNEVGSSSPTRGSSGKPSTGSIPAWSSGTPCSSRRGGLTWWPLVSSVCRPFTFKARGSRRGTWNGFRT